MWNVQQEGLIWTPLWKLMANLFQFRVPAGHSWEDSPLTVVGAKQAVDAGKSDTVQSFFG